MSPSPRCAKCRDGIPHTFEHGAYAYGQHGCRCGAYYRTKRPRKCPKCEEGVPHDFKHGAYGYTRHGCRCSECVAAARKYHREYYAKDREGIQERRKQYYKDHPERARQNARNYSERHKEHAREYQKKYYQTHSDYLRTLRRRGAKKTKSAIPGSKIRNWDPWELKLIQRDDIYLKEMAAILRRSYYAVTSKRQYLAKRGAQRRFHRTWSPADLELLARTDLSNEEIAELTGRPAETVRSQRGNKGLRVTVQHSWTPAESELAVSEIFTVDEIAEMLQLPKQLVANQRYAERKRRGTSPGKRYWTPEEDLIVLSDLPIGDICAKLVRTRAAVFNRRSRLLAARRDGANVQGGA